MALKWYVSDNYPSFTNIGVAMGERFLSKVWQIVGPVQNRGVLRGEGC